MSKREGFIQLIHFKARELSINPKLLMMAVSTLARNSVATEKNVFPLFFKELVKEARQETDKKIHSIYRKAREEAESALKPINKESEVFANSAIYGSCQLSLLMEAEENILQLHYTAWSHIIDQKIKIKRLYGKKYIPDDAVQIIKYLCPKEIQLCANAGYFITI